MEQSKNILYKTVNNEMINLYWTIGKMIVEKHDGNNKAKYGNHITEEISIKLTNLYGKDFQKEI